MERRVDFYPTHEMGGFRYRRGQPLPFGATMVPNGVNFSIYSNAADSCTLVLFRKGEAEPMIEIPFSPEFKTGNVFAMVVFDLEYERIEYGYRMDGPFLPGQGHRFDRTKILSDPYAKILGGRDVWREQPDWTNVYRHRARLLFEDFDWEDDRQPEIPLEDLVIYEMHVRGFTCHPSSGVSHPGTLAAIRQKIPHLKSLGINCVELMPIAEFDEWDGGRRDANGQWLLNYWGYSTAGFMAPKAGYAATGRYGMQADELKALIKELHHHGIEVILDVVFNHTSEGNENGPTLSFRGIDNKTYYMLTPDGYYYNFTGAGNTLNCNHPVVRNLVLDCLRYWVSEYHVDGFRFDLASILGRDQSGAPLANPPLLETLAHDPVLARTKLIAEAWDAGGLYQVGSFPAYGRWAEWNGKFRDASRRFLRGDAGLVGEMAQRIQGSPDLYPYRGPTASINFVTCHDGFTLNDLVSYNDKYNESNGEGNRDGGDDNNSWNCGYEGETSDAEINRLRRRQIKNAITLVMISHGVPMILMGDELGRTQRGNNNAYCQDNEISWMDWGLLETNADLFRFTQKMIAFRKAHPVLRRRSHLTHRDLVGSGYADITFHGTRSWWADWSSSSRVLAFLLCGRHVEQGEADDYVYVIMNMHWEALSFRPPALPPGMRWHAFANTGMAPPEDIHDLGAEPRLEDESNCLVGPRSIMVIVGRAPR
ncbi:glycogen debranching protein GlgX [Sorangium sp. So ce136]|uniref:glycogen debranching protein GlgX n=1 Tax=Sorangium sp. So ce136 TaxID=3133284 RepID=UPI003F119E6F